MNPFEAYAQKATSKRPDRFLGPIKTRAEMRAAYDVAVKELHQCNDVAQWEADNAAFIAQLRAEHQFFWEGEDDFLGLEREIAWAHARVDDRLDFPRWG